jgi:hypothetical protein
MSPRSSVPASPIGSAPRSSWVALRSSCSSACSNPSATPWPLSTSGRAAGSTPGWGVGAADPPGLAGRGLGLLVHQEVVLLALLCHLVVSFGARLPPQLPGWTEGEHRACWETGRMKLTPAAGYAIALLLVGAALALALLDDRDEQQAVEVVGEGCQDGPPAGRLRPYSLGDAFEGLALETVLLGCNGHRGGARSPTSTATASRPLESRGAARRRCRSRSGGPAHGPIATTRRATGRRFRGSAACRS